MDEEYELSEDEFDELFPKWPLWKNILVGGSLGLLLATSLIFSWAIFAAPLWFFGVQPEVAFLIGMVVGSLITIRLAAVGMRRSLRAYLNSNGIRATHDKR